jgi:hypothetical protein
MMDDGTNSSRKVRFTGVWVYKKNLVYVRAVIVSLEDEQVEHAAMFRFDGSEWTQYMIRTPGAAHCVIPEGGRTVLTLSPFGVIHTARPEGFGWEQIDSSVKGPNTLRHLRDIRPIGDKVYVTGMDHMVYRRTHPDVWERFAHGFPTHSKQVSGFLTIDGCSESNMYVGGFRGEMWFFDGEAWQEIQSPTNVKVERIRSVTPELNVACGAVGLILTGSADRWKVIPQTLTDQVFWGLEYFLGKFYLATTNGIFSLVGDELLKVDLGVSKSVTTARLHAGDGVLWSVGETDIFIFDGDRWSRCEIPFLA